MSNYPHWIYNPTRGLYVQSDLIAPELGDLCYTPELWPDFLVCEQDPLSHYLYVWNRASPEQAKQMKTYLLLEGVPFSD